jgi:hypothetical protein
MADEGSSGEKLSELHKIQFDYAWKWFAFHADQRIKMFNFMLLVFGVFAAGVVNALDKRLPTSAIASLCFVAAGLAEIFVKLDRRNRDLVRRGEDVLKHLEREVIFGEPPTIRREGAQVDFGILTREASSAIGGRMKNVWLSVWLGKHRLWLPMIGHLIAVLFLAAGFLICRFS